MRQKGIIAAALLGMAFASCGEKDLYNPEYTESLYEQNFIKKYGNIDPTQSWDLSQYSLSYSTRADGLGYTVSDDYVSIDKASINEFFSLVEEGKDNRSKGKAFVMTVPNNPFTIVPQFMNAAMLWDLYIVVGDEEIRLWSKGENMQCRYEGGAWMNLYAPYYNTNKSIYIDDQDRDLEYRAKAITLNTKEHPLPVGEKMYFYLKIADMNGLGEDFGHVGDVTTSIDGHMLTLEVENRPSCVPQEEGYKYKMIGCEDVHMTEKAVSDKDLNDFVFCIYGAPEIPKEIEIKDGEPILRTINKRYMIEDLGSTDDFDFNDVIVDVKQQREETPVLVNGAVKEWKFTPWKQTATLRHLGGTIPFS